MSNNETGVPKSHHGDCDWWEVEEETHGDCTCSTKKHWLLFSQNQIVGCHCGFAAGESDGGWGDSVLQHVARDAARQALLDACEVLDDVDPDDIRTWLRTRAEQIGTRDGD